MKGLRVWELLLQESGVGGDLLGERLVLLGWEDAECYNSGEGESEAPAHSKESSFPPLA